MSETNAVLRVDEQLARWEWPVLTPVDTVTLSHGDVLVLCAGFEDRATWSLDKVVESGSEGFAALVVEYLPAYKENRRKAIEKRCAGARLAVEWITYDRRGPAGFGDVVCGMVGAAGNVYIDVSAMSRMLIVQLIVALAGGGCGLTKMKLLYTEAAEYSPARWQVDGAEEKEGVDNERVDSYISSGVWELAAVPELAAPAAQAEALRLVVFPSFNAAQLRLLLQELQPTFVDLVNGVPPRGENAWRPAAIRRCNEKAVRGLRTVKEHPASTLDYRETLDLLLRLYDARSAFDKLVVAPTGSKMQSVAIGILRVFLEDVQVVYPTPQEFLERGSYTVGTRRLYRLDLEGFAGIGR